MASTPSSEALPDMLPTAQAICGFGGHRGKNQVWEGFSESMEQEEILANTQATQEGKAAPRPHGLKCGRGAADLN